MKDIYIHYGSTHFRPEAFKTPMNQCLVKPIGGLWASLKNNDHAYTWKMWCEESDFCECSEQNSFSFTLKDNARVHYIYCPLDLLALPVVPLNNNGYVYYIDFEKCIDVGIDAIELRYFGDWKQKSPTSFLYWALYGWDCDCILILNPDCIERSGDYGNKEKRNN